MGRYEQTGAVCQNSQNNPSRTIHAERVESTCLIYLPNAYLYLRSRLHHDTPILSTALLRTNQTHCQTVSGLRPAAVEYGASAASDIPLFSHAKWAGCCLTATGGKSFLHGLSQAIPKQPCPLAGSTPTLARPKQERKFFSGHSRKKFPFWTPIIRVCCGKPHGYICTDSVAQTLSTRHREFHPAGTQSMKCPEGLRSQGWAGTLVSPKIVRDSTWVTF